MDTGRRRFLGLLGLGTAGLVLDSEQLLWVPGRKTIFLPSEDVELVTQFGIDIQFSSQDLALTIDDFSKRFITPAIAIIANRIDRDLMSAHRWQDFPDLARPPASRHLGR